MKKFEKLIIEKADPHCNCDDTYWFGIEAAASAALEILKEQIPSLRAQATSISWEGISEELSANEAYLLDTGCDAGIKALRAFIETPADGE